MAEKKFSKGEAIRFGWNTMKTNFWFFIGFSIVVMLIYAIPGMVADAIQKSIPLLSLLINVASFVLNLVIQMGLLRFSLRYCDNEKGAFADLFSCFPLFFKYLAGSVLYGLMVMGGLLLLVIPGVIWAIKFQFFSYLIVEGLGPVAALKKSAAITRGAKWDLFIFGLVIASIILLGVLCVLAGLLVAAPTTYLAGAFVYRKLLAAADVAPGAPAAPTG